MGAMIATRQNDLKKVFAYSTVSQLGYMFMGVAAMAAFAGVFHLITHAFFKALLFLTAGNVMHALAGQLDLNKMSGLGRKMPVTKWLMLAGCLALAGFPLVSGFWSKDMIIAYTFDAGMAEGGMRIYLWLGAVGLITAFLTAYYAFRAWFRVFTGPEYWEMGRRAAASPRRRSPSCPRRHEARRTSAELAADARGSITRRRGRGAQRSSRSPRAARDGLVADERAAGGARRRGRLRRAGAAVRRRQRGQDRTTAGSAR